MIISYGHIPLHEQRAHSYEQAHRQTPDLKEEYIVRSLHQR
ncbi:hypothetical protein [Paenibacillus macquariensis]|nr:hypothetical protein [Paenibacillus macquariensis]MEC0091763.1 hypothetical protein [Paenibacillus macquariensis]